jgi:hypothetical protein
MQEEDEFIIIKAKLLAKRESDYTVYVFQLEENDKYIMCTKCPNWSTPELNLYQEGFLKYKSVRSGKDIWYDSISQSYFPYKYTANYFMDFIPLTHVVDGNRIIEHHQLTIS